MSIKDELAARKPVIEPINIGTQEPAYVRQLGADMIDFILAVNGQTGAEYSITEVIYTLCDANGKRAFNDTPEDREVVRNMAGDVIIAVSILSRKLNSFDDDVSKKN